MSFVSENLRKLIGESVLIGNENEVKVKARIVAIGETKGWLVFNANGTLAGQFCNLPSDHQTWEPEMDFPGTKCAVKFSCLIFEEVEAQNFPFDEYSFAWQFADKNNRNVIDNIIDQLLEKTGVKTEVVSL